MDLGGRENAHVRGESAGGGGKDGTSNLFSRSRSNPFEEEEERSGAGEQGISMVGAFRDGGLGGAGKGRGRTGLGGLHVLVEEPERGEGVAVLETAKDDGVVPAVGAQPAESPIHTEDDRWTMTTKSSSATPRDTDRSALTPQFTPRGRDDSSSDDDDASSSDA